jgi:hypothetical protein
MKKKRKPKKRIGTSWALLPALLLATIVPSAEAAKKKPPADNAAIVSGSVFNDSGYALPDADVTLAPEGQAGSAPGKVKPMEAVSDARGEFIFHVPPGPAHYTVSVAAKGFQSQRKSVSVEDQERVEVTFQLERESK